MEITHGSLFSGIGGFDLAAEWCGIRNVFQAEIDSFCTSVLEKNFPDVCRYGDIKDFKGIKYEGEIDIISGDQHFFWYSVPVYGYSWSYEYTADALRVMGLVRAKLMEKGFAEFGPGAFIFWDWAALGAMASLGYRIGIGDRLAIPVKFRAEFVAVRDASPVVVGLSAGISYTLR